MTLVVGILCKDGVVIGADSAITFALSSRQPTIEQPYSKKITVILDQVIIAGTGAVGLGQRFAKTTEKLWKAGKLKGRGPVELGRKLASEAIKDFNSTQAPSNSYGALVALPAKHRPQLIEFSITEFQPEVKNEANWYASMGAGQSVADPLLGFVRRTFGGMKFRANLKGFLPQPWSRLWRVKWPLLG